MKNLREALRDAPFRLDEAQVSWVYSTLERMPLRKRLAQLFNVMLVPQTPEELNALIAAQPGAVTQFLLGGADAALTQARKISDGSEVPLLISADVEGGAISMACCTPMNNQLGMAAMDHAPLYEQAVGVMAEEAAALGVNWSFTPVVDINEAFRSAIVATRSFGTDQARIEELARVNVRVMQSKGIAATAKHWPGEGLDDRDQHLVTTINPLSMDAWRERFGRIYRTLIDDGVLSIMSAHIALPSFARERGETGVETCRPASISRHLNQDLLRGELNFNGLIVSDATPMGGLSSWGPREQVIPEVIQNGCDMVLFTINLDDDLDALEAAISDGRLTIERVHEAAIRVLALKASLGLNAKPRRKPPATLNDTGSVLASAQNTAVAEAVAAAAPTLVKDVQGLVPITQQRHHRVVIVSAPASEVTGPFGLPPLVVDRLLEEQGFEVRAYDPAKPPTKEDTDLVLFVLAQESLLTKSHIYLDWAGVLGPLDRAMSRDWHHLPTALISFGHPYYLYDAPRMPCVINAYTATVPMQRAVVRKLLGQEVFRGVNPVDPFCALPDAYY